MTKPDSKIFKFLARLYADVLRRLRREPKWGTAAWVIAEAERLTIENAKDRTALAHRQFIEQSIELRLIALAEQQHLSPSHVLVDEHSYTILREADVDGILDRWTGRWIPLDTGRLIPGEVRLVAGGMLL